MMTNLTPEDIRRLQVLNDYIAQSIDAVQRLNPILQQRGLWHSPYGQTAFGTSPWSTVGVQPFGTSQWQTGHSPFAGSLGVSPAAIPLQAMAAGLSHTGLPYPTVGGIDPISSMVPGVSPFGGNPFQRSPFGVSGFGPGYGAGLTHTPFVDPVLASLAAVHGTGIGQSMFGTNPLVHGGIGASVFGTNPLVEAYRAETLRRAVFGF